MGDAGTDPIEEKGLVPPASVLQSTKKCRDNNNSVGQWIASACFLDLRFERA